MIAKISLLSGLMFAAACVPLSALANTADAAKLGSELTPVGANPNGNEAGTIPPYSGKWLGVPPGIDYDGSYSPNPYADEEPDFTITADNMEKYADHLTEGEKTLFKQYPDVFKMHIYPTHRDFRVTDLRRKNIRLNARNAHLENDGLTLKGAYGGVAFPVPDTGLQVVYNVITAVPAWLAVGAGISRYVHSDGSVTHARNDRRIYTPYARGNDRKGWEYDDVFAYSIAEEKAPARRQGKTSFTANTYDYKNKPRQSWQYDPGTRRLRKAPDVGFDYPESAGPRVIDEQRGFNGSPVRYDWKLIGKREMYVPFDTYRLDSRDLKYKDFITDDNGQIIIGTPNPKYFRYELRRVWIVEGTLKPEYRHIYQKRRMYVDEDSWFVTATDLYDNHGELWRASLNGVYYDYSAKGYYNNVAVHYDLDARSYSVEDMNNEQPHALLLNQREPRPGEFTPAGILRSQQ